MAITLKVLRTNIRQNIPQVPRWAARFAKIAAAAIVVLILIALVAPFFVDVDRYRPEIASAIQAQTGRTVRLGKIHAQFLPRAAFVLDDFHLGNPAGFPGGDLLSAQEIRGNLALLPLLHGNIHLTSLDLVNAKVELLADEQGRNNYTFAPAPAPAPKASVAIHVEVAAVGQSGESAQSADGSSASPVSLEQIDHIELTNAELVLASVVQRAVMPIADVRNVNMTLRNFVVTPLSVRDWQADSKLSGVELLFGGWSAPVEFHSGQITLSNGKVDAQFVADLAKAGEMRGTLSVPDIERPQTNFEMSAAQLDLDALIAAVGPPGTAPDPPAVADPPAADPSRADPPSDPPTDPPPASADALVASGHVNIEKITTKPYQVGPANADIRMYADRMELWPITVGMYGGTLQVSARVDRTTSPARFTANVQVRGVNVAQVLNASPSARGKMSGTGDLDLQLLGSLSDGWKKLLSGSGKFSVRNGLLPGINLVGAAQSLAKLANLGANVPFRSLAGDVSIADQSVSSKQIELDASAGKVDLHGSLTFAGALDYQAQATLSPSGALGSSPVGTLLGSLFGGKNAKLTIPFTLRGTIEHPQVTPSTAGTP